LIARVYYRSRTARARLRARSFGDRLDPYRFDRCRLESAGPCHVPGVEEDVRLCERGGFYESLQDPPGDLVERARVKQGLFEQVLFPRNHVPFRRPLLDRFKTLYPDVAWVLFELKKKDHRRSAWLLQNLESRLMISRCCGRLMTEQPDTV